MGFSYSALIPGQEHPPHPPSPAELPGLLRGTNCEQDRQARAAAKAGTAVLVPGLMYFKLGLTGIMRLHLLATSLPSINMFHWRKSASPVGPPKHWFVLFSCLGVLLKKGNLFAACMCLGATKAAAGGTPGNAPAGDVFMSVLPSSISNEGQVRESMC